MVRPGPPQKGTKRRPEMQASANHMLNVQADWAVRIATREQLIHRGKQAADGLAKAKAPAMIELYTELLDIYRGAYKDRFVEGRSAAAQTRLEPGKAIGRNKLRCTFCGRTWWANEVAELVDGELPGVCFTCRGTMDPHLEASIPLECIQLDPDVVTSGPMTGWNQRTQVWDHPDVEEGLAYQTLELEQERLAFASDPGFRDYQEMTPYESEAREPSAPKVPKVSDGTYTVLRPDGVYVTVRIETQPDDATFAPGDRVASFLSGPDNETHFTGFAFVNGLNVNVWRRFRDTLDPKYADAVRVVLGTPSRTDEFREAYALRSGRCARCGHKLTVPASLHRGLGPDCARQLGVV